jgi:hypothetical protein
VSDGLEPAPLPEELDIQADDGHQPPGSVHLVVLTLLKRLATCEALLNQHSSRDKTWFP